MVIVNRVSKDHETWGFGIAAVAVGCRAGARFGENLARGVLTVGGVGSAA